MFWGLLFHKWSILNLSWIEWAPHWEQEICWFSSFLFFKKWPLKRLILPKCQPLVMMWEAWPLCLRVQNCPSPWRLSGFWSFAGIQAQSILPAVAPCLARKSGLEQPSQETPGPTEPEITHWIFLQEWLPGFRKNTKGEENLQKEKKKKEVVFFSFTHWHHLVLLVSASFS